ncbi:MAG: hypothetical protein ACK53L_19225, partial [Pirellulaceae bacterium]
MKSSQVGLFLERLEALIDAGQAIEGSSEEKKYNELSLSEKLDRTLEAIATDLLNNRGSGLITVGAHQEIDVQQTVLRLNEKLGNIGKTYQLLDIANPLAKVDKVRLDDFVFQ